MLAAVGLAVDDEFVAGGDEPVDRGLGEQRVAHHADPFIWGWHMFVRGDLPWDQVRCVPVCLSGPQGVETLE